MTRTKLIGFSALAVCVLGYCGFGLSLFLAKTDVIAMSHALMIGVPSAIIGEIGLWVAAGALGWSILKGRKAILDRLLRRAPSGV